MRNQNQNQMEMKMATSKDFVDAVVNKNNLEAEDAFKAAIQTKVGDALEAKRKEVSKTLVKHETLPDADEAEE